MKTEAGEILEVDPSHEIRFDRGRFRSNEQPYRSLVLRDRLERGEWWDRQQTSVDSYKHSHEAGHFEARRLSVYRLFGAYLAAALRSSAADVPLILDVGCGIFPKPPPYIEALQGEVDYVGLDPLPINLQRGYPFICARLEDLAELEGFQPRFNLFVFATSADHIEDLDRAADAVRHLATPDAQCVFWNGLQDPILVAADNGARVFEQVVQYSSRRMGMPAYAAYGMWRLPRLLRRMRDRRRKLDRGDPLDDTHFRFFTEQNLRPILSVFGSVEDSVTLPNYAHNFSRVRVGFSGDGPSDTR